jgi:type I restriction enzyme, S subunit
MDTWQEVQIGSFLKERPDRFKPDRANELGLKRLEKIDFSGNIHINGDKQTKTNMILVKKGDVVISGINVEKGAISVYEGEEDVLATIHYSSYSYDIKKIDIQFFRWFLRSRIFKDIVKQQIKGGIKTELKPKKFLPLKIMLPLLEVQQEIKIKLSENMNGVSDFYDNVNENCKYLVKLQQAILKEAVEGKLVPQDPNDEPATELLKKIKAEKEKLIKEKKIRKGKPLPPISDNKKPYKLPKGWEWVRLGDTVSILGDGLHGTPNYSEQGNYNFVNGNNLCDGKIVIKWNTKRVSEQEYIKYRKPLNDRTIFVSINGTIGNVAFYDNEKIMLGKSACYFNLLTGLNKDYYKLLINSKYFLDYAISEATGTTIKNVSLRTMRYFLVPLPPAAEQKRIVEKVDQLMHLCDQLEAEIKDSQKNADLLWDTVLREAFSAK